MKMKKIYVIIFLSFIPIWQALGQTSRGIHYKALLTDTNGAPIANQSVDVQVDIMDNFMTLLYRENHSVTTDVNGIMEFNIGEGNAVQGNFSTIDWEANFHYKVKVNLGNGVIDFGNMLFLYVPFAKRSDVSTIALQADYNNVTNLPSYMADGDDTGGATEINELTDGATYSQGQSVYLGTNAGSNDLSIANYNTGVGFSALRYLNDTGKNTAIGAEALMYNNGHENTALGYQALLNNSTARGNTAAGVFSSKENETGTYNVAIGLSSLENNMSGNFNVAVGVNALKNSFENENIAIGSNALSSLNSTSGVSGADNIAFGAFALRNSELGNQNIAFGSYTGNAIANQNKLIMIGDSTVSGPTSTNSFSGLTTIGSKISTSSNTDFGFYLAIGNYIFQNIRSESNCVAIGVNAMHLAASLSGVAIGKNAIYTKPAGTLNKSLVIAIGKEATYNTQSAQSTISLGAYTGYTAPSPDYSIAIGYAAGGVSNTARRAEIGNSSVSWIGGQVTFSTTSDRRIKEDVREDVAGLDFILRLRPVTYHLDIHKMNEMISKNGNGKNLTGDYWPTKYEIEKMTMTGFIAQEVEQAAREAGYDFSGVQKTEDDLGLYSLSYAEFTVPLVKATQEQQHSLEQIQNEFEVLESETGKLIEENRTLIQSANMLIEELINEDQKIQTKN